MFLKEFFVKVDFEKKSAEDKSKQNYPLSKAIKEIDDLSKTNFEDHSVLQVHLNKYTVNMMLNTKILFTLPMHFLC